MTLKKIAVAFSLPLFLSSFLFSQSVVELTKKEKERRASLKNQKVLVITNSTLRNLTRRSAVIISGSILPTEGIPPEETTAPAEATPPEGVPLNPNAAEPQKEKEKDINTQIAELEQKWNSQKEYVSLLSTRIAGLWQEFYSMDDMTDRGGIQKEIAETSQKLDKAQQDEAKMREDLEKLRGQVKK
jgi:uncharacterized coiled-coil protein SlyX